MSGELHNIQQLSDAVVELQGKAEKSAEQVGAFLVSQVQPINDRIASLEKAVSDLQAQVKAITGAK
jgi:uncharacterized coiled-coil protein SlyX